MISLSSNYEQQVTKWQTTEEIFNLNLKIIKNEQLRAYAM
jgi:hypothetical protein